MADFSKRSSIVGLIVVGAGLGLYLGSSAISEINPAHYGTPSASTFHADLSANPGDRDGVHPLPELAAVAADQAPGCVTCSLSPDEYALINYPSGEGYDPSRPVAAGVVLAEAEEYVSQGLSPSDSRDIERYAHFRVSDDEEGPAHAAKAADDGAQEAAAQAAEEPAPAT